VSPVEFVRFLGMPALIYWCSIGVEPLRAKSKSLAASSRAAGGREDGDGEVEGWTESTSDVVDWFDESDAAEAADWP
jgi:hypothetical protein